jgi:predicted nucleotidyltransferase
MNDNDAGSVSQVPTPTAAETLHNKCHRPGDRDFFRTREGMFFCVAGHLHPPERYTAYLKYSPDSRGKWQNGMAAYRRELPYYHVRNVAQTLEYLQANFPDYVADCPVRGIRFSLIPRSSVAAYYDPQSRLASIMEGPADALEQEAFELVDHLCKLSSVGREAFGLTGSILIGLHNLEWSDIDLLVYGRDNAHLLKQAIIRNKGAAPIGQPNHDQRLKWARRVTERFPVSFDDAWLFSGRRWNYGYYGKRYFSIHPVRTDAEVSEHYGDHIYRSVGEATIRAVVVRKDDSIFLPATYHVDDIEVLSGRTDAAEIHEIVSHEGLFCDIADEECQIEAAGQIETIDGKPGRLIVGAASQCRREFIRLV